MRDRWTIVMTAFIALAVIVDTTGLTWKNLPGNGARGSGKMEQKAVPSLPSASRGLPPFPTENGWIAGDGLNVKDFAAKGDGITNDTAAIQAAIDSLAGGGTVYFPKAVYIAKNIVLRPGVTLNFAPGTVLKFPIASGGTDRMIIVGELDGGRFSQADREKEYKIIGNGLDIDATHLKKEHSCYGIFVSGAKNFLIQDVQGHGFQNGYLIEVIRSYGSIQEYPQNGHLKNIRNFGEGWGGIAIETGQNLLIEDIYSDTTGVDIECDVDVMGHGVLAVQNVEVRNITTGGGFTLNINAHQASIENIRAYGLRNFRGTLVGLYADTAPGLAGSIRNVIIDTGTGDGGGVAENGLESPNNVVVDGLIGRNINLQNYREFGFKCNGGDWYNCSARNNGLSGWKSTAQADIQVPIARFYNCEATDNNTSNSVNHSGWNYSYHARVEFYDCLGTDTREYKQQWYAVYADGQVLVRNCRFDGNKVSSIAPIAKQIL